MTASDIYLETMRACLAEVLGNQVHPRSKIVRRAVSIPTKRMGDRQCKVIDFLQARDRLRNFTQ